MGKSDVPLLPLASLDVRNRFASRAHLEGMQECEQKWTETQEQARRSHAQQLLHVREEAAAGLASAEASRERAEAREAAWAPVGRMDPSRHVVPRRGRVAGTGVMTHTPTCGTREGVTRRKRPRWANARVSKSQPEAERMTADDEGNDSSRLLSRQGLDLQDEGASSESRDDIFASRDGNPDFWPPARSGAEAQLVLVCKNGQLFGGAPAYSSRLM